MVHSYEYFNLTAGSFANINLENSWVKCVLDVLPPEDGSDLSFSNDIFRSCNVDNLAEIIIRLKKDVPVLNSRFKITLKNVLLPSNGELGEISAMLMTKSGM